MTITVINYSGGASELGGVINLVDRRRLSYHALSIHLCGAKLITHFDGRPVVAKFSKSRVWGKVPEGNTLFLELPKFPYNTVKDMLNEAPMPKPAGIVQLF